MASSSKERMPDESYEEATACAPLNHPLRVRILEVANCRDISPIQFVNEQLQPAGMTFKSHQHALSHVAYHFRALEKAGCIEVVDKVQRRGATEHVFRGTTTVYFTDAEFERLPLEQRKMMSRTSFQGLIARTDGAMRADTFDRRRDRWLVWVPIELDEQGWDELTTAMAGMWAEINHIWMGSKERLAASGNRAIPATFGMLGYESPPPPLAPSAEKRSD
jgi:hypothetical protein